MEQVMDETTYAERAVYQVLIKAPIDTVWSELVNTTSPRPFFWNSSWDTKEMAAGNAYRVVSADDKVVAVVGEILEMDPPRRMVTSFRLTQLDDSPSKVTYELEETDEGTEFRLITENVVAGSKSDKEMGGGSEFIVRNFKAYIETGKITFGARMMLAMMSLMSAFVPKSMRAENWPLGRIE